LYTKILEIKVEEADWDSANLGSVVHKVLENSINFAKDNDGEYTTLDDAKKSFEKLISGYAFSNDAVKENLHKHGLDALDAYYPIFSQVPVSKVENVEFKIEGISVGDNEYLEGKIDRIEKNSDGTYNLYDYKTGKAKSLNDVTPEGKKAGYFNQLCFYKYAFEKMCNAKVSKVGLIFVEEPAKSITLELTNEDMAYIETLIKETFKNVKSLNFNPTNDTKGDACKYCVYKQLCKLDVL
ncbi:PD-(D/E)XK nuclease family protein, partial [bacterium]|nr:PD-(D/E)XK nuclease family protein [bacterium]